MLSVKAFVCNELQENTYVVYNESKNCVIIDAGNHLKEEDEYIIGFIDRNGLKPIMLLNTHSHIDHMMGNAVFAKRYGIPLASHPIEKPFYAKVWMYAAAFGIDLTQDRHLTPTVDLNDGDIIKIGEDDLDMSVSTMRKMAWCSVATHYSTEESDVGICLAATTLNLKKAFAKCFTNYLMTPWYIADTVR